MRITRNSLVTTLGPSDWFSGAAPDRFMTRIAIQEADDSGSPVTWGEHVTDEEYNSAPAA